MNHADKMLELLDNGKSWGRYAMYDQRTQRYCLMGANHHAAPGYYDYAKVHNLMREVIAEQYPNQRLVAGIASIIEFNDDPDTNWDDIRAVLEKVSTKLDEIV